MISVRYGSPHPLRQAVVFFMRQQCGWCSLFPGRVSCSGSELHGIPRKCVTSILLATRFGSRCRAKRRLAVASDVLSWHYSPYRYMFCNESCVLRFQIKFRTGKNAVVLVNCCNSLGMHESVCLFFSTTAIVIFPVCATAAAAVQLLLVLLLWRLLLLTHEAPYLHTSRSLSPSLQLERVTRVEKNV